MRLEFLGGARRTERTRLKEHPASLPYLPLAELGWEEAVRHGWTLRDAGLSLPWNDILIASLALRIGIRVYARDAHFDAMERALGLRLYKPGPGGSYAPDDR